ncbi:MAG TPA: hypothetical protein VGN25_08780 [Solirubrobacteraceae bacterium]|jgi:type IV secretory pathway VirB10-like protein|nr:hypothetical protein [Solirubrobacteraceae bacterium]
MRIHTTHTRDAALRQLHTVNRWMIAGSVVLTGVLSDVAAHAFPGKTTKSIAGTKGTASKHAKKSRSHTTTGVLKPPAQAPKTTSTEATPPPEARSSETPPAQESAEESAPARESAPAQQEAPPAQEPAPAQESAPPQQEAPVVSGGS